MNVYILTEITKRELDSNLLLACIAADNNIDVIISNSEIITFLNDKKLLKKGLFHTKSLVHGIKKKKLHILCSPSRAYYRTDFYVFGLKMTVEEWSNFLPRKN